MRQHDVVAAKLAPALGRAQHQKKDRLAASAALVSYDIELQASIRVFSAKQAWAETRHPYVDALSKCSRDSSKEHIITSAGLVRHVKNYHACRPEGQVQLANLRKSLFNCVHTFYNYKSVSVPAHKCACGLCIVRRYGNSTRKSVPRWYYTLPGNGTSIHFLKSFGGW
jgi:hypothetical protein